MKKHFEIRFGGSGGQGMMLMGDILAEAAGLIENKEILLQNLMDPNHAAEPAFGTYHRCNAYQLSVVVMPDFVLP
jgi:Pyruvate/2-oxoacid:ferredoxin oxidoreductase gamma subunit